MELGKSWWRRMWLKLHSQSLESSTWSTQDALKKKYSISTSRSLSLACSGFQGHLLSRGLVVLVVLGLATAIGYTQRLCTLKWMNLESPRS